MGKQASVLFSGIWSVASQWRAAHFRRAEVEGPRDRCERVFESEQKGRRAQGCEGQEGPVSSEVVEEHEVVCRVSAPAAFRLVTG